MCEYISNFLFRGSRWWREDRDGGKGGGKMGWMWGLEGREPWGGRGEGEEYRVQVGDEANAFVLV